MTNLNTRNESTAQSIATLTEQLTQMQQMILNLQGEVRSLNQQHKAQETLTKEWNNTTKTVAKQFKDACSVYGSPDAIDDMLDDLQAIAEEVKDNFDTHAQSDRFLNQETAEQEDEQITTNNVLPFVADSGVLPDEDDNDTVLSPKHIEIILEPLPDETLKILKTMLNVSAKVTRLSSIAHAISKHNITHSKLSRLIQNIEGQQLLLSGV